MSDNVVFQFLAEGILAILAGGAVLMALVSVTTGPFDPGLSASAGWWAIGFFVAAVLLALLEIFSRVNSSGDL